MAELRWVDRDAQGHICGIYACRQRDGQESLAEDSAELVAHLAAIELERVTTQTTEAERATKLRILADWLRGAARNVQETLQDQKAQADADRARFMQLENWAKTKGYPGYTP